MPVYQYEFLKRDVLGNQELNKSPPTAFNKTKLCHITNPDHNKSGRESLQQAFENGINANLRCIQLAKKIIISISCIFHKTKQTTHLIVIFGVPLSQSLSEKYFLVSKVCF